MVVDRAEDRRDLAEALRAPAGADHDHADADVQNDVCHAKRHARDAREHDPPGQLFPDGVHDLALFDLLDKADGHAGHDLDKAERHGADEDRDRVVKRSEERGERLERRIGVDDPRQLRQEIAEEAARQRAHDKCADAAGEHEAEHLSARALGPGLFCDDDGSQDHQQSIAHVRHHDAVEQNEKRRHERVRVHAVIGGEGIHLRDHVEWPCQPVVLELDRHVRIFLRRRVLQLPCAAEFLQQRLELRHVLTRHPAVQTEGPF